MVNIIHIAVSAAMATTLAAAYVVSSEQQQSLHDPRIRLSRRSPQPETPQAESKPSEKAAEKPVKTYAQCMADCREEWSDTPVMTDVEGFCKGFCDDEMLAEQALQQKQLAQLRGRPQGLNERLDDAILNPPEVVGADDSGIGYGNGNGNGAATNGVGKRKGTSGPGSRRPASIGTAEDVPVWVDDDGDDGGLFRSITNSLKEAPKYFFPSANTAPAARRGAVGNMNRRPPLFNRPIHP